MLTVKKLIAQLSKLDPDARVILQHDAEGNGYSNCVGAEASLCLEFDRELQIYSKNWTADECCMDKEEHAAMHANKKNQCVIIWPE